MDLQYLRRLIKIINDSKVDELEIEEEGTRIRVTRTRESAPLPVMYQVPASQLMGNTPPPVSANQAPLAHIESSVSAVEEKNHSILSPIVGTFYRAPAPDADPYVQVGQTIAKGNPICIIEAMKIMNEIESDVSGKVIRILVENGQPVEYNQPLFLVEL